MATPDMLDGDTLSGHIRNALQMLSLAYEQTGSPSSRLVMLTRTEYNALVQRLTSAAALAEGSHATSRP